jgi:hypothetical protein
MGYADKYICEKGTTVIGRKGTIDKPLFGIGFGLVYGFKSAVKDGNDSFLFG